MDKQEDDNGALRLRRYDVISVGNATVDNVLTLPGPLLTGRKHEAVQMSKHLGGEAVNASIMMTALGVKANYVGRFGGDPEGTWQRAAIEAEGCETEGSLVLQDVPHHAAFVIVGADGERSIVTHRDPRLGSHPTQLTGGLLGRARAFFSDGREPELTAAGLLQARAAGLRTFVDAESGSYLGKWLPHVDEVIVPELAVREFAGATDAVAMCAALLERGPEVVVITRGADGALAQTRGAEMLLVPAHPAAVVDTTGAGDAFHGAYIAARLNGAPVAAAVDFAAVAGARTCEHPGPRMPVGEMRRLASALPGGH